MKKDNLLNLLKKFVFTGFLILGSYQAIAKLGDTAYEAMEKMSEMKLDEKRDFELVKTNLKNLLIMNKEDPTRIVNTVLADSYNKYQKIYDKAFDAIQTKDNKAQIKEAKKLLKSFYRDGNG